MTWSLDRIARTVRTLRHLRTSQFVGQLRYRVSPPGKRRRGRTQWNPVSGDLVARALAALGPVADQAEADTRARAYRAGRLEWLGETRPWSGDWQLRGSSPLWAYHLHYHEHLADAAWLAATDTDVDLAARVVDDIAAWQSAWAPGGRPAWDPYPTSVRLVNWLRVLAWTDRLVDQGKTTPIRDAIADHLATLEGTLEWHLDGNHLLKNACALSVGALTQGGARARGLQQRARRLLERIVRDQVLADGWHYERTPSYHVRAIRDLVEVRETAAAAGSPLPIDILSRLADMERASLAMWRRDGSLWQLNDSNQDFGVAPPPLRLGARTIGTQYFESARTLVAHSGSATLRADLGGPAPAHQPGHAHAGALGFELDIDNTPLFVDCGVSGYDGDPLRATLRGTAAHNTVRVAGRDQSEMWATFRVGGRASVTTPVVAESDSRLTVSASCLPFGQSGAAHHRTFSLHDGLFECVDRVTGADGLLVESFLHLGPGWKVDPEDREAPSLLLRRGEKRARLHFSGLARLSLHHGEHDSGLGWYAHGFNRTEPIWTIRFRAEKYHGDEWRVRVSTF